MFTFRFPDNRQIAAGIMNIVVLNEKDVAYIRRHENEDGTEDYWLHLRHTSLNTYYDEEFVYNTPGEVVDALMKDM